MTDKAKEQYRVKIYQLLETLKNNISSLKVETRQLSKDDRDEYGGVFYVGPNQEEYQKWKWDFRLDPKDQHTETFMDALSALDEALNSKEGVRFLPRGLYRSLIEFGDHSLTWKAWSDWSSTGMNYKSDIGPTEEELQSTPMATKKWAVAQQIKQIIREIHFYENEREESEESFLGSNR